MALHSLYCADVPLRNCSLTHWSCLPIVYYIEFCFTLVRSLVLGRLDNCNGLIAGCTSSTLHHLQRVQDAAARLVCGAAAHAHAQHVHCWNNHTGCR